MTYAIGIDIGGTKIAGSLVNSKGEVLFSEREQSDPSNKENMFYQVVKVIERLKNKSAEMNKKVIGIGVGLPGKVDAANGIAVFQNNLPWENYPIVERLQTLYPTLSIKIENDVAATAIGEVLLKRTDSSEVFTYITISTGIASASLVNGQLIKGKGFSGELGLVLVKNELEDNGYAILENSSSGTAIRNYGRVLYQDSSINTEDVFKRSDESDEIAMKIIDNASSSLAHGLVSIISLLDPGMIVIGGSVATNNPKFIDEVKDKLSQLLIPAQQEAVSRIIISDSTTAPVVGAASLILNPS